MNVKTLNTVFTCCIVAGLAVPVFDIVMGGIGDFFNIDFDFDGDTSFDGPIPVNVMSIAFATVVFGAIGKLCLNYLDVEASLAVGIVSGLAGGYLIGRFLILPLKRNRPCALKIGDLKGQVGTVKLEIRSDFKGTVMVLSSIGSKVTYDAKPVYGVDKIGIGQKVLIEDVDEEKRVCIVRPTGEEQ